MVLGAGARPVAPRQFTVTALDIGQGDATLLQVPGGAAVLVDGGAPGMGVAARLHEHGVRSLDAVVLTHAQEDHQGGLAEVLEEFPVRMLLDGGLWLDGPDAPAHRVAGPGAGGAGARRPRRPAASGSAPSCGCGCCLPPRATPTPGPTRTCAPP